jgi:hypothetical protein
MGVTMWEFVEERGGGLRRIPLARWLRLCHDQERWPERAAQELRTVNVILEVQGRRVQRLLRVTGYRIPVSSEGQVLLFERSHRGLEFALKVGERDADFLIRELEYDASAFWVLEETHISDLARALGVEPDAVRAALFRKPSGAEDFDWPRPGVGESEARGPAGAQARHPERRHPRNPTIGQPPLARRRGVDRLGAPPNDCRRGAALGDIPPVAQVRPAERSGHRARPAAHPVRLRLRPARQL